MSRGFAAANATAVASSHVRPVDFAELQLDSGTLRLHNAAGTITWGGNDWTGVGGLISMGVIEEGEDSAPRRFWLRLNAFDSAILAEALTQNLYKRTVKVYLGLIGDDGALVADPHDSMWEGFSDSMVIVDGEQSHILLECELEVARDNVANGSLATDEQQQKRYPGDTGFQYLDQMVGARIEVGPNARPINFGTPVDSANFPRFDFGRHLWETGY